MRLAILAIAALVMVIATLVYVRHPEREYLMRWDEGDDGWGMGV